MVSISSRQRTPTIIPKGSYHLILRLLFNRVNNAGPWVTNRAHERRYFYRYAPLRRLSDGHCRIELTDLTVSVQHERSPSLFDTCDNGRSASCNTASISVSAEKFLSRDALPGWIATRIFTHNICASCSQSVDCSVWQQKGSCRHDHPYHLQPTRIAALAGR